MSATAGKVALVRTGTVLSGACPSGGDLADLIGFGGAASCAETSPIAELSNTTAAVRLQAGATDTDNNSADFVILAPTPRNSAAITTAPAADVVISQVYGGGGNSGADLKNDFIELRNREAFDVSVAGWTVQYTSAGGSAWAATALNGIIPAGGYYLVQEAAGSGGSLSLPTPDAAGNIAMSATSGKVALVAAPTLLTGACPLPGVLDFVGYGAASCFEGSGATPTLSNTTAAIRHDGGLVDTNDNAADFLAGVPSPKSTVGVPPTAVGAAAPASIASGTSTLLTLKVTPGAFPPGPVTVVTVDLVRDWRRHPDLLRRRHQRRHHCRRQHLLVPGRRDGDARLQGPDRQHHRCSRPIGHRLDSSRDRAVGRDTDLTDSGQWFHLARRRAVRHNDRSRDRTPEQRLLRANAGRARRSRPGDFRGAVRLHQWRDGQACRRRRGAGLRNRLGVCACAAKPAADGARRRTAVCRHRLDAAAAGGDRAPPSDTSPAGPSNSSRSTKACGSRPT